MSRFGRLAASLGLLSLVFWVSPAITGLRPANPAPTPPDSSFFSPQTSPDGGSVIWESMSRGGSIWLSDGQCAAPAFLTRGHSPSWSGPGKVRFVVSQDDGHRLNGQMLFERDLESGTTVAVSSDSDNPAYDTVVTPVAPGVGPANGGPLAGKIVCVDPGHGKSSGATAINGKKEDHYCLIMSYLARDYLEAAGATVRMTRFDDSVLPLLPARVNFSNSVAAEAFVAVHLNSSPNASANGLEVYHRAKDNVSRAQARRQHDAMIAETGLFSRGVKGDKDALGFNLAVLSEAHATHNKTLTEGCFLTNPGDAARLEQTAFLDELAWGIYAGLSSTLGVTPVPRPSDMLEPVVETFASPTTTPWIGGPFVPMEMDTPEEDDAAAVLSNEGATFLTVRTGPSAATDYTVSATVRSLGEAAVPYGLLARCNQVARDGDHLVGYELLVDEGAGTCRLVLASGSPANAVTVATGSLFLPGTGIWRSLSLRCQGDLVTAAVDGQELTPVVPGRAPRATLADGKAGLVIHAGTRATIAIDRIQIDPL